MNATAPILPAPPSDLEPGPGPTPNLFPGYVRTANTIAVAIPFAAFLLALVWLWGWGVGWTPLILLLALGLLTSLGITVGFHRLFTHRAFEAGPALRVILAIFGSMAAEGPVLKWAAVHRRHHQHSDDAQDPHSPNTHEAGLLGLLRGLWHAHVGWLFAPDAPGLGAYVPDLAADPLTRGVSNLFALWVFLGLLIPTVIGGLVAGSWTGALLGLLWGGLGRIFLVHHLTWSINSICHLWGTRPFRTRDLSRNNPVFGFLGLGEGWHNNHHAFPTSARHGLRWWEFDASYLVIRLLALTHLAWSLRLPTAQALADKRRRTRRTLRDACATLAAAATESSPT
jgi:stearoyl-CoA desaturase (delta-9 desaturase)